MNFDGMGNQFFGLSQLAKAVVGRKQKKLYFLKKEHPSSREIVTNLTTIFPQKLLQFYNAGMYFNYLIDIFGFPLYFHGFPLVPLFSLVLVCYLYFSYVFRLSSFRLLSSISFVDSFLGFPSLFSLCISFIYLGILLFLFVFPLRFLYFSI